MSTNLTQALQTYSYAIEDLSPGTEYVIYVEVVYKLQNLVHCCNNSAIEIQVYTFKKIILYARQ